MPRSSSFESAKKTGRSAATRTALVLAIVSLTAGPALACDCVRLIPGSPRFQSDVDRVAQYYPVAAEGVLEPDGPYAWRFRTEHEYRGPGLGSYPVELISDCSLAP